MDGVCSIVLGEPCVCRAAKEVLPRSRGLLPGDRTLLPTSWHSPLRSNRFVLQGRGTWPVGRLMMSQGKNAMPDDWEIVPVSEEVMSCGEMAKPGGCRPLLCSNVKFQHK